MKTKMKTKQVLYTLLIAALVLAFASCEKNEHEVEKSFAELIIGKWKVSKHQKLDGENWIGTESYDFLTGIIIYNFIDASKVAYEDIEQATYTIIENQLTIHSSEGNDVFTIVTLDENTLILEWKCGYYCEQIRRHLIRVTN